MSEFPVDTAENGDMHTVMENFQKKNNLVTGRTHHVTHHPQVTTTSSQVIYQWRRVIRIFFSSLSLFLSLLLSVARKYLRIPLDALFRVSLNMREDSSPVFLRESGNTSLCTFLCTVSRQLTRKFLADAKTDIIRLSKNYTLDMRVRVLIV